MPRVSARTATFREWAQMPQHFADIKFDPRHNYLTSRTAITFFCETCGIRLVKDGNHRLLQCAITGSDVKFNVYEVRGRSWTRSTVDMRNFCSCTSNTSLEQTRAE